MAVRKRKTAKSSLKLSSELLERITQMLRVGVPLTTACEAAGVTYAAYQKWEKKAKEGRGKLYSEAVASIKKARAEGETRHIAQIVKASQEGAWQASAWMLERTQPEKYARPEARLRVSGELAIQKIWDKETFRAARDVLKELDKIEREEAEA